MGRVLAGPGEACRHIGERSQDSFGAMAFSWFVNQFNWDFFAGRLWSTAAFRFTQMVRLGTHVVRRCKALQAAAWQRHARFEATQQVRSNCVFQVQNWARLPLRALVPRDFQGAFNVWDATFSGILVQRVSLISAFIIMNILRITNR